jgi:ornithine cyclodeaminase
LLGRSFRPRRSSDLGACELDTGTYARARIVAVEWLRQSRGEAGGLIDAVADGVLSWDDVSELGDLVVGRRPSEARPDGDVTVFQSVGIGLEDVAVAAAAWRASTQA